MCSSDLFPSHDTFDAGKLIPIYVDEVLPGDTFSLSCTAFGAFFSIFYDEFSFRKTKSRVR